MKANEFVKNHGWEYAKGIVIACESGFLPKNQNYDDLKRIIESHELVESKGGLAKAKEILADNPVWCSGSKRYSSPLEQAILDVESCQ